MNAFLRSETVFRIQKITGKPISRGLDKAITEILDEFEKLISSQGDDEK